MNPIRDLKDEKGHWLLFGTDEVRLLTAFEPGAPSGDRLTSLGWPSLGVPQELTRSVQAACREQFTWLTKGFGPGYRNAFDLKVHVFTYGSLKTAHEFPVEELNQNVLDYTLSEQDPQFARVELVKIEGKRVNLEFALWMRFGLDSMQAIDIPYGGSGIMLRRNDLLRHELEDTVATFILRTHIHRIGAETVRDLVRTVSDRFRPIELAA